MAALCIFLVAACGYDYRKNKIPNFLVLLMALLGIGWRFGDGGLSGILWYFGQAVLVMALIYPFFKIGTIGAGDVKLLGLTAGYLPFQKILVFLFVSLLVAAVISLFKLWKNNYFAERMWYLLEYLKDVLKSGRWQLYLQNQEDVHRVGICLSGPVLISVLLYMGGVY